MKYLVTGGAGFIGSHIVQSLLEQGESVSGADLIAFCRERLAPYKSPKSVVFRDELPRNAMGKVQKAELRKNVCPG